MIRIGIAGIAGRMGQALVPLILADPGFRLVGGTVRSGNEPPVELGTSWDGWVGDQPEELAALSDVVIDVTTANGTAPHAHACADAGCAFVTGATGRTPEEQQDLATLAERIPVVEAANFSPGIAAIAGGLSQLVQQLASFDAAIIESHHRGKLDEPSGTALQLAGIIRLARDAEQQQPEVAIRSLRTGGSPAEHTVILVGEDEQITIGHQAFSRRAYAAGALRAARYAVAARPGLYTMSDVLMSGR